MSRAESLRKDELIKHLLLNMSSLNSSLFPLSIKGECLIDFQNTSVCSTFISGLPLLYFLKLQYNIEAGIPRKRQ